MPSPKRSTASALATGRQSPWPYWTQTEEVQSERTTRGLKDSLISTLDWIDQRFLAVNADLLYQAEEGLLKSAPKDKLNGLKGRPYVHLNDSILRDREVKLLLERLADLECTTSWKRWLDALLHCQKADPHHPDWERCRQWALGVLEERNQVAMLFDEVREVLKKQDLYRVVSGVDTKIKLMTRFTLVYDRVPRGFTRETWTEERFPLYGQKGSDSEAGLGRVSLFCSAGECRQS